MNVEHPDNRDGTRESGDGGGAPPLPPGSVLAPGIRVVSHVVRGRHVDVYRVRDDRLDRSLIAKVVRPDGPEVVRANARLRREIDLLARVDHPNIVRGMGVIAGGILVEDMGGETLKRRLRRGARLSWREVARIGFELGSALDAVHRASLVHCDVKPENVVVGADRYALIDFDLARAAGHVGAGIGTRAYLAPEQAHGGLVGPPADAWGLGVVLFRAASGALPFAHADSDAQADGSARRYPQIEGRAPSVSSLRDGGGDVALVIDALLDPRPACRPVLGWAVSTFEAAWSQTSSSASSNRY